MDCFGCFVWNYFREWNCPKRINHRHKADNIATNIISYKVIYSLAGRKILTPLEQVDGPSGLTKSYKLGSTLPIKFQLFDVNGASVGTARAKLVVTKTSNGYDTNDPIVVLDSGSSNDNGI